MSKTPGIGATFTDAWLVEGVRTPFTDYNGALASVSPIDLGIKVGREVLKRAGAKAEDVGTVITGNMAQASFDAYMLPRHIGLYSGVPVETPAHHVQRVCGTGIEALSQASDAVSLGRTDLALCVGTESMSRNPVASYTSRGGFRMGRSSSRISSGKRCSIPRRISAWATPRKIWRGNIRSPAATWMPLPHAASIARWRHRRMVFSTAKSSR